MDTSTPSKSRFSIEFEVERVIGVSDDGQYQVQWAPAWVSKFHLVGCEHLIEEFMKQKQQQLQEQQQQHQQQQQQQAGCYFELPGSNEVSVPVREVLCDVYDDQNCPSGQINEAENHEEKDCLSTEYAELRDTIPKPVDRDSRTIQIKVEENESRLQSSNHNSDDGTLSISSPSFTLALLPTDKASLGYDNPSSSTYKTDHLFHKTHSSDMVHQVLSVEHLQTSATPTVLGLPGIASKSTIKETPQHEDQRHASAVELEQNHDSQIVQTTVQSASRKKGFPCPYCEKSFNRTFKLSRHILVHTGEQPFSCSICGKSYQQENSLKQHMRAHTGEKPFLCNICGKSYSCNRNLKTHMNTHTGKKPYACRNCGKAFHDSSHCNRHMKSCTSVTYDGI